MDKQLILKIFQEKLRKGESIETLTLKDLFNQVNVELEANKKTLKEVNTLIWQCQKCNQLFDYCWCNPNVH